MKTILLVSSLFLYQSQAFIGWNYRSRYSAQTVLPADWEATWSGVGPAPPHRVVVEWGDHAVVGLNTTMSVGLMGERPTLYWPSMSGELYTVMIVDTQVKQVQPKVFVHWMVTNIPGTKVSSGNEVMQYVTPFSLELNEDGSINKNATHTMVIMVYKQKGKMVTDETQYGCSPDLFSDQRIVDQQSLVTKYGLEVVGGNLMHVPWSGYHTQQMVCRVSRCLKYPYPQILPGVNDLDGCKPRQDIIDMTITGPKLDKMREYGRTRSALSLHSVPSQIRDLYPVFSTGKVKVFTSIQGAYDQATHPAAYIGTDNQEDILEGVVDTTFLNYPSKESATQLFSLAKQLNYSTVREGLPYQANNSFFKIILSQPYDQDFDFETVIEKPGMVFDLNIVKRKEGEAGKDFIKLRKHLISLLRSNKNVVSYRKFIVDEDIQGNDEDDLLYFDSSNNYISFIVFESMEARARAFADIGGNNLDFLKKFYSTFDCIMCATLTDNLHQSHYPPFIQL